MLVEARGSLRLHAMYYITKQIIPALERCFSLVGADLRAWFAALPRPQRLLPQKRAATLAAGAAAGSRAPAAGTIERYYLSRHCAVSHFFYSTTGAVHWRMVREGSGWNFRGGEEVGSNRGEEVL